MSNFEGTPYHEYSQTQAEWDTVDIAFARDFYSKNYHPPEVVVRFDDPFFPPARGELMWFKKMGQVNWLLSVPGMLIAHTHEFIAARDSVDDGISEPHRPKNKDDLEYVLDNFNETAKRAAGGDFDYRAKGRALLGAYTKAHGSSRVFDKLDPMWIPMIDGYVGTHKNMISVEANGVPDYWSMIEVSDDFKRLVSWIEHFEALRKMARVEV